MKGPVLITTFRYDFSEVEQWSIDGTLAYALEDAAIDQAHEQELFSLYGFEMEDFGTNVGQWCDHAEYSRDEDGYFVRVYAERMAQ